jgi:hypothetical protein
MNSPATSSNFDSHQEFRENRQCIPLNFFLSFECLFGVLYSSFAGAIIFGKLTQFQSCAQVKFSNVLVVGYGDGEKEDPDDDSSDSDEEDKERMSFEKLPCPVLKFRLANLLKSRIHGNIVNCSVDAVATVNIKNSLVQNVTNDTQFRNALQSQRNLMADNKSNPVVASTAIIKDNITKIGTAITSKLKHGENERPFFLSKTPSKEKKEDVKSQLRTSRLLGLGLTPGQIEDLSHNIAGSNENSIDNVLKNIIVQRDAQMETPNMVFAKIQFSPESHPCFNTSWLLTHTLNADSSLLKKSVRKKILNNGGYWPPSLDTEEDIKDSIDFDQILVSFKGSSQSTGNDVYHNHVYKLDDLHVGFEFQSMLVNVNGVMGVDDDKIDNIKPQKSNPKIFLLPSLKK